MALDKGTLTSTLTSIFSDLGNTNSASAKASAIANAIDAYVKSATVNVVNSSVVAPPGTSGGPCIGTGNGSLS